MLNLYATLACGQLASMQLTLFNSSGPHCTDGSPAGFYFREASVASPNKKKWIVWLEGGGICQSNEDCWRRSKGDIGSSSAWPNMHEGAQLISAESSVNPDFHDWNHVWVPYCSGDVWLGQATEPTNPWATLDAAGERVCGQPPCTKSW